MPTASVIIPCYNAERFLAEAIASVRRQTAPPIEILVVDDGSTDASAQIAETIGGPVRVIRQANHGESVARNVGLREAAGDYVMFLDADDLLAPESIEQLTRAVTDRPGAVGLTGFAMFTDDPAKPFERSLPSQSGFFPGIVRENFGPPHCWFTPRDLALRVGGFREDLINSEDWEFWGRMALSGASLVAVPYEGALYRRHPNSQVARTPNAAIFRGRLLVCETLARGVLNDEALFATSGEAVFWSLWAMLDQARRGGVHESELQESEALLRVVASRRPAGTERSLFRMAVRWLGSRAASRIQQMRGNR